MPDAATVFITNMSPARSYESAARYGAIRPVTSGNYPVFKTDRLLEEIVSALIFSAPSDYLLFSGSSVVAGLCLSTWLALHKQCKMLLWDRRQGQNGEYIPKPFAKSDIIMAIERERDKQEDHKR